MRPTGLGRVHATRISTSGGSSDHARVIHIGRLTEDEMVEIGGVRTTSLARTLVDLGRIEPFEAGVIAADNAFHLRPATADEAVEVLGRSRQLRGHPLARQALLFADGRSESVGETRLRVFVHRIGLQQPELQCDVFGSRAEFLGRIDLAMLEFGLLMEFDGMVKYGKVLNMARGRRALAANPVIGSFKRSSAIRIPR